MQITNSYNFIYWLQGFFEVENPTSLNEEQTALIKQKLESCFQKVTGPQFGKEKVDFGEESKKLYDNFLKDLNFSRLDNIGPMHSC